MSSLTAMGREEGEGGQVSLLRLFCLREITRLLKMTLSFFSPSHPLLSSKEGSYSFSFILILGLLLSYNIPLLERQLTHAHFPFPILQVFLSPSGRSQTGLGELGKVL